MPGSILQLFFLNSMIFFLDKCSSKRPLKYRVYTCNNIIITLMIPTDSSILLSLFYSAAIGFPIIPKTLFKIFCKGTQSLIKLQDWGQQPLLNNQFFRRRFSMTPLKLSVTSYSHLEILSKNLAKTFIALLISL